MGSRTNINKINILFSKRKTVVSTWNQLCKDSVDMFINNTDIGDMDRPHVGVVYQYLLCQSKGL